MADLPTAITLTGYGIDTLERAVTWSALSLFEMVQQDPRPAALSPYRNSITVQFAGAVLRVGAVMPYSRTAAIASGLGLLGNLLEIVDGAPPALTAPAPNTPVLLYPMPEPPSVVDTLEKYFLWAALQLHAGSLVAGLALATVTPTTGLSGDLVNPAVQVVASIPYDLPIYNCTGSLLRAIGPVLTEQPIISALGLASAGLGVGGGEA